MVQSHVELGHNKNRGQATLVVEYDVVDLVVKLATGGFPGQCSEIYCASGTLTGNADRTSLTMLTCSTEGSWVDTQAATYTTGQCETPCDKCTALTNTGMTCPTGFVCRAAASQSGQCPVMTCTEGEMKVNPGNVAVTSLSCDGSAQWIDSQSAVYTAAQCES
ncbi:unnamed protein product [Heligmosomoides polygyrus]|uniref:C6 domain-containing protein n=1 Tax=Heligmosomoides polygyrus TaxID=6339 RepID=A0A183GIJ2_HELPZ|nr:unnamed protein product [Heligmosomoides polygyrus]